MIGFVRDRLGIVLTIVILSALAGACTRFESQPISAENKAIEFGGRELSDEGLRRFLESNDGVNFAVWPKQQWNLQDLTLAALYFNPDLDVLRAQLAGSRAAEITAGQRPTSSISISRGTNTTSTGIPSGLDNVTPDVPIETAGKRGYRISEATYASEAATWDLAANVEQIRADVRKALLALYGAGARRTLLQQQESLQAETLRLLEAQLGLGAVSAFEVTQARIALQQTRFSLLDVDAQQTDARAQLANAIGLPPAALVDLDFAFEEFQELREDVPDMAERRDALINRADVRSALASYAATQAALQLEVAKQYPDIHLGPAYELDQGDTKWFLGVSLNLPFSKNKGPIAQAEAKRAQSAAEFDALQAKASNEIDQAVASYRVALNRVSTADALSDELEQQQTTAQALRELGEISGLELVQREVELNSSALLQLDARLSAQESLGNLQSALQNTGVLSNELWLSSPRQNTAEDRP